MPDYRRCRLPGGRFFFTVVTADRAPLLTLPGAPTLLRESFAVCRQRWPFALEALVILPDHLHTIWSLPEGDAEYSRRWAGIKQHFTRSWRALGRQEGALTESHLRQGYGSVWQPRFWEHTLVDDEDYRHHLDYIHYNPVRHGLVRCPHEWPRSTFRRFVRTGLYPADWGCSCDGRTAAAPSDVGVAAAQWDV